MGFVALVCGFATFPEIYSVVAVYLRLSMYGHTFQRYTWNSLSHFCPPGSEKSYTKLLNLIFSSFRPDWLCVNKNNIKTKQYHSQNTSPNGPMVRRNILAQEQEQTLLLFVCVCSHSPPFTEKIFDSLRL